jgi:hypothetical protein
VIGRSVEEVSAPRRRLRRPNSSLVH